ncbi:uncharacterized protein LOC111008653 [Momordica charantia]|uniref:Uncharacterized protein LOC111008653 n=1 Tax=Momordica charantia TaxID=3673 RepID=A0A6J1C7A1_MOMCH|nr:uncharacterized protein LOC111008653 [Momordica charantia]
MAFHNATQAVLAAASLGGASQARTVVGGPKGWCPGVNYTEWAIQNQLFYYGDALVFKYSPMQNDVGGHSVWLLPDLWRPFYCGSSEGDGGFDCGVSEMKFMVVPWLRLHC